MSSLDKITMSLTVVYVSAILAIMCSVMCPAMAAPVNGSEILENVQSVVAYSGKGCPDISTYRTERAKALDAEKLRGMWYELAYSDLAQLGSTCQTMNVTVNDDGVSLKSNFSVKYLNGKVPFTIIEEYRPKVNGTSIITGVYDKTADMPGGKFLVLPTVVVDVTVANTHDDANNLDEKVYDTLILAVCKPLVGTSKVTEVQFFAREHSPMPSALNAMKAVAKEQGVPTDENRLRNGTWTASC